MKPASLKPAAINQADAHGLTLSGCWTARGLGSMHQQLVSVRVSPASQPTADGTHIEALDTAGAWVLQELLRRLRREGLALAVHGLRPEFEKLMSVAAEYSAARPTLPLTDVKASPSALQRVGRDFGAALEESFALLSFVGETALVFSANCRHPERVRWRTILYNVRTAGFDALPIVGVLAFLLGLVVAYQGADQLRQYGANIFVADLVGLSMLREFAPLITAIIIAGRSASAYAAQIGTMFVTEEIDAMRTLGIVPFDLLVLPKILALVLVLPLLTVFADILGVFGGMLMARAQLDVGFGEFLERFTRAVGVKAYLIGFCKAPVFAVIIAVVGCFQGFRTRGGADSVGRKTTRSVVQSIFLVIVADALFSVAFSALDL